MRLWVVIGMLTSTAIWTGQLLAQSVLDVTTPPTTAEYEEMIISPEEPDQRLLMPADQKASQTLGNPRPRARPGKPREKWNAFEVEMQQPASAAPSTAQ
jgi:hypothetical protein